MNTNCRSMRDVFLLELIRFMKKNKKIIFVTADFGSPVLDDIRKLFPERYINVGIAEQNLINVSTGLALEGFTVFAYAIAPFISMRCYEQIRVNLAILSQVRPMNVNLIGIGAGYSYVVSGPTHQCLEDLSIIRTLPNIDLFSPSDSFIVKEFVGFALNKKVPKYIRLDAKPLPDIYRNLEKPDFIKGFCELQNGKDICIISTGYMTHKALKVSEDFKNRKIEIGVIDLFMLNEIDEKELVKILRKYSYIITYEEGFSGKGGLDSKILSMINSKGILAKYDNIGLSDNYSFELGTRDNLHEVSNAGLSLVKKKIEEYIK